MEKSFSIPMSRRSFMKLMGLAAAGTVLGVKGDAAKAEAASPTISTMDFDNAELHLNSCNLVKKAGFPFLA